MNGDEKFQQRWEFRRKDVGGDSSSDDNHSNTSGPSAVKKRNLVTDIVLPDDDEASNHPQCQSNDDNKQKKPLQPSEKKLKSKKMKQVKKENKRKKMNPEADEIVMFKGLKDFSESLIQEFAVSRENMLAHMRDEMKGLVAKKKPITKKKVQQRKGKGKGKGAVKPKNSKTDACKNPKASDEAVKIDHKVLEVASKNETGVSKTSHMNFNQEPVSSPYLTLPTVISCLQYQNPSNHYMPSNDHVMNTSNTERDIRRMIDNAKFGTFSHRSVGLSGQNCPRTTGVPFLGNGSNISNLTYCESPFLDRGNSALSDQMFAYSNIGPKPEGELGSVRPKEVEDGQFYSTGLRNHR